MAPVEKPFLRKGNRTETGLKISGNKSDGNMRRRSTERHQSECLQPSVKLCGGCVEFFSELHLSR